MPGESTLHSLHWHQVRVRDAERSRDAQAVKARADGHSWAAIAKALGVSRKTAYQRYRGNVA